MPSKFTCLALLLASLTASLPILQSPQNTTAHLNSIAPDISTHALAKRTTANPEFDIYRDREPDGDIYRLSKCYCVDTRTKDLPPVYGKYYGHYYGFDYYNYHQNKSYAYNWTCRSGELATLNDWFGSQRYMLAPKCLSWQEEDEKKECWDTGDGNKFCVRIEHGKDWYYWNGQKRRVHNHPTAPGSVRVKPKQVTEECQRMCETIPGLTMGSRMDTIEGDLEHRNILATASTCSPTSGIGMGLFCNDKYQPARSWEFWNYIETYYDQADMCKGCA